MFGTGNFMAVTAMSHVKCTGGEDRLINCSHYTQLCDHEYDAAVICNITGM